MANSHAGRDQAVELWNEYDAASEQSRRSGVASSERLVAARNALLIHYMPLVQRQAVRLRSRLPHEVSLDDLVSEGMIGLMDAIAGFDRRKAVRFQTYAPRRVRGAMVDHLRAMDWVPRLARQREKLLESAREQHRKSHGQEPSSAELTRLVKQSSGEESGKVLAEGAPPKLQRIAAMTRGPGNKSDGEVKPIELVDPQASDPLANVNKKMLKAYVTRDLTRAERLILILYYYEGMTMREIGMTLDLSESRVSQMLKLILERLRAQLVPAELEAACA